MGFSLHPYTLLRRTLLLALAVFAVVPAVAQQRGHAIFKRADRKVAASGYGLLTTARAVPMTLDVETFKGFAASNIELPGVPVTAEKSVDLELQEFSVLDKDSKLTYTDEFGRHPVEDLSVRTYRGKVAGEAGSDVFMAIADHTVVGLITTGGVVYQIVTDFEADKRAGELAAVAFPTADLPDQKFACGIKDLPFSKEDQELVHNGENGLMSSAACPTVLYSVLGAFDADYEFYVDFTTDPDAGGIEGALSYMVTLVSGMSNIYERDGQFQIVISSMNVWTSQADPYTESALMPIALDEAKGIWNGAPYAQIERGFAQVMSGKNWSGIIGIANGFDLICDRSESITFQLIKNWDPIGSIAVIAHELGHLTGLRHTHSCTWNPHIDECAAAESGNCFAGTSLTEGTIMSYCKQKLMKIHGRQIGFLRTKVQTWGECSGAARKLEISKTLLSYPVTDINVPIDSVFSYFFINRSVTPVTVSRMTLEGDVDDQFEIIEPTTPFVVGVCDSVGLRLKFKAEIDTTHRARLYIYHDGLNVHNPANAQYFVVDVEAHAKNDVPILGFRTQSTAEGYGIINFGNLKVDAVVDTNLIGDKSLFLNIGRAALHVDSSAIIGPDRNEFELTEGSAPFVLSPVDAPGNTRRASIRFNPQVPGDKEAWLKVWSNSFNSPTDSIKLTARVRPGPVLDLKVPNFSINFGDVLAEKNGIDTSFDDFFYNNGTDTLTINAGVTGPDAHLFVGEAFWFDELAPGEGLPLALTFFAQDSVPWGWKNAMIIIASNTPRGLDTIQVTAKLVGSAAAPDDKEIESAIFMIVPNPSAGDADIFIAPRSGELGMEYTFRILDTEGKEVRRETGRYTATGIRTSIRKGDLPSGVYYISVTTDKGMRSHAVTITR